MNSPIKKEIRKDREGIVQRHFFAWLGYVYPQVYQVSFHIPNGGARNKATGAKLKAEGVRAGVPDIMIAYPCGQWHGLFIEMKAARPYHAAVSEQQKIWLQRLARYNYRTIVCYGLEEAKQALTDYLSIDQRIAAL